MQKILKSSQLFAELDDASLRDIAATALVKKAHAGEMIFNDGEAAHSFYIVASGKVKVFKLSPDGKEQILMLAQPGDTFAEAAMFAGVEYPASAEALETSELVAINRDRFAGLLARSPELALNLIARLAWLLRQMTRLIEGLSLSDVTTRLARYLCALRVEGGDGQSEIHLEEKKGILAAQLGTIPETLSRSFAKLTKDGLIRVDGPRILILNAKRLQELAESGR